MTTAPETNPGRGRPRSETARQAILASAMDLLLDQGLHAMSMDDVARRAGVSKATIYRWWPSKERLAVDALAAEWAPSASTQGRDTGTLRGDLVALMRPWVRQLKRRPYARVVAGLLAVAQTDAEFAELYRQHFMQPRRNTARDLLVRARERGQIAADTDVDLALDLLYGPVYHRLLHGHAPLTDQFAQDVIDAVLRAISPTAQGRLVSDE
jgi:AcrR family transcriptional regulator